MNRNLKKSEVFESSHLVILMSFTLFCAMLIAESLLLGWEKWALMLIAVEVVSAWVIHIQGVFSDDMRLNLYTVFMMLTFFFYGIHETSTLDLATVISALIMLYTMTGLKKYILFCQITYFITLSYDLMSAAGNGTVYDSLEISRIMLHIAMIFMIGWFARVVIDRWTSVLNRSHEEIKELSDATERLNDFLANVSHEIRTPVNAIIGLSGVCLEKEDREDIRSDMKAVLEAGRKVADQISDILDYSEIDSNKLTNNCEDYMITSVLNDIVTRIRPEKDPDIELIIDVEPSIPAVMNTDVGKLKKILMHLIQNGLKYTKDGGVYVRLYHLPQEYGINLCIEVSDTGMGMDEEELEHIFEGFYQGDSGRTRSSSGLGLGLSIVEGFVASLGGFMSVESKPDVGTHVRVSIPQKVVEEGGCMSISNRDRLCLGAFLRFEKYPNPRVREYYDTMVRNIVCGFGVQMHRVENSDNLKKLDESVKLTHLFVAEEEYNSAPDYIEKLAHKMIVTIVSNSDFKLPKNSKVTVLEKPFYCVPVAAVLNRQFGEADENDLKLRLNGVRALVVDDESMNLVVARGVFKGYGMVTETVNSGYEAIEACRNEHFDVIFMDHMMPGMDGVETMKRIRSDKGTPNAGTPIIALTANAISTAREMFMAEGFDGFVSKPIELIELERALKKVLPESMISYENPADMDKGIPVSDDVTDSYGSVAQDDNTGDMEHQLRSVGIDVDNGRHYCNDDEEFYKSLLMQFASEAPEKLQRIERSFAENDFKNYEIYVHALKSTSKMIGAIQLSKMAKSLEDMAVAGGTDISDRMHKDLVLLYETTVKTIKTALGDDMQSDAMGADGDDDDGIFEFDPS